MPKIYNFTQMKEGLDSNDPIQAIQISMAVYKALS